MKKSETIIEQIKNDDRMIGQIVVFCIVLALVVALVILWFLCP